MKKKILIIIIILILSLGIYQIFFRKAESKFTFTEVSRGNVIQEVSETGQVKKGEEINLSFKNAGKIEKIYVKLGDKIDANQDLVKLDTSELVLQLKESQANLQVIQAERANTEVSLKNAQQNLEDTISIAEESLANVYRNALNVLDDAYLKIYNAYSAVSLIKQTYFERGDQESVTIGENKVKIKEAFDQVKFYIDNAKKTLKNEDIDLTLSKVKEALSNTRDALEIIRNMAGSGTYKDIVLSSDKTSLDTQKLNINTAYSDITDSQQDISTTKINNTANINTAKSKVSEIENQLQETQEGLYQAKIKKAEVQVSLLQNQIKEAVLKSPTVGQITKIDKKEGEMVQPGQLVVSFLSANPLQVKVDIYEEDIIKVNIGDPVDITITAFPGKILKGKVVAIDPAEKLIEGVVYYEVTIDFDEIEEGIKPGMTADILIKTELRENVLVIPEEALEKKDDKVIVKVLIGKNIQEREINIGLIGSDDRVEVISGLKEGEMVVLR